MLSEEERKAIERLEEQFNFWKKQNIKNSDCEIILNLIAKLQKENEELKQENKRIKYFSSNLFIDDYIPKKVIKDKIKEIEEDKECYYYDCFLEELDIEKTINILEKILGDE